MPSDGIRPRGASISSSSRAPTLGDRPGSIGRSRTCCKSWHQWRRRSGLAMYTGSRRTRLSMTARSAGASRRSNHAGRISTATNGESDMAHACGSCGKLEAPPGSFYCEGCRVRLILSGMVELALPGEIDSRGGFTPYVELKRAERAAGVERRLESDDRRHTSERRAGSVL